MKCLELDVAKFIIENNTADMRLVAKHFGIPIQRVVSIYREMINKEYVNEYGDITITAEKFQNLCDNYFDVLPMDNTIYFD